MECEGLDEKAEFAQIRGAMKVLNFEPAEQWNIWELVAACLHMGNIAFGGQHHQHTTHTALHSSHCLPLESPKECVNDMCLSLIGTVEWL